MSRCQVGYRRSGVASRDHRHRYEPNISAQCLIPSLQSAVVDNWSDTYDSPPPPPVRPPPERSCASLETPPGTVNQFMCDVSARPVMDDELEESPSPSREGLVLGVKNPPIISFGFASRLRGGDGTDDESSSEADSEAESDAPKRKRKGNKPPKPRKRSSTSGGKGETPATASDSDSEEGIRVTAKSEKRRTGGIMFPPLLIVFAYILDLTDTPELRKLAAALFPIFVSDDEADVNGWYSGPSQMLALDLFPGLRPMTPIPEPRSYFDYQPALGSDIMDRTLKAIVKDHPMYPVDGDEEILASDVYTADL
ncbi:hypothetical protein B0H14DRAFT_3445729 [Mycena olivaceomarginata]|nr:hypothetical protein B0H14DRAFT_3445729 [Mycena olivaceomarginata]